VLGLLNIVSARVTFYWNILVSWLIFPCYMSLLSCKIRISLSANNLLSLLIPDSHKVGKWQLGYLLFMSSASCHFPVVLTAQHYEVKEQICSDWNVSAFYSGSDWLEFWWGYRLSWLKILMISFSKSNHILEMYVLRIMSRPLPFKSLKTHYSLSIISFDAIWYELLIVRLNKPQINKKV
jgi:hypothetical protein